MLFHKSHVVPKKDKRFGRVIRDCTESTLNRAIDRPWTQDKFATTVGIVKLMKVAIKMRLDDISEAYRQDKTDPRYYHLFGNVILDWWTLDTAVTFGVKDSSDKHQTYYIDLLLSLANSKGHQNYYRDKEFCFNL